MQRILSVETSRSSNASSEFVTKRLCCSFILTVAFFAVIGGFFLGRFASDKTLHKLKVELSEISKKLTALDTNLKHTFQEHTNCSRCVSCEYLREGPVAEVPPETSPKSVQEVLDILDHCFSYG